MGTTAEKGAYIIGTKSQLKTAINNLGGSITDETTFRQYVNQLDGVYDVLPKTSFQEGTEVTIEGGLKGKIDFDDGKVGFGQASQESTQGKNLNKITNYTNLNVVANVGATITKSIDKVVISTTTSAASGGYIYKGGYSDLIKDYDASKTYYISADVTFSANTKFKFGKDANSYVNYTAGKHHIEDNFTDASIVFYTDGTASTITLENIMVCETASQTYEPYAGGYASPSPNWEQEVKCVAGRNILDDSKLTLFANNRYISTIDYLTKGQIPVNSKKTYSLVYLNNTLGDIGLFEYDSSNTKTTINAITLTNGTHKVKVFNLLSTTKTFGFYAGGDNSIDTISQFLSSKEIMLLEGDYSTKQIPKYIPYNTIQETIRGKNLFEPVLYNNETQIVVNNISSASVSNGEFSLVASGSDMFFGNIKSAGQFYSDDRGIKIYKNGNSKISVRLSNELFNKNFFTAYDKDGVSLGLTQVSYTGTYTFPDNCEFVTFRFGYENSVGGTTYKTKVILAYGDTIPDYEPYVTPRTYQFSLGNNKFYSIGDYADELLYDVDEDKVYKNEKIEKRLAVITGGNLESHGFRASTDGTEVAPISAYPELLCNFFKRASDYSQSVNADWLNPNKLGINAAGGILCNISNFSTLVEYNDFFSNNDVYIYYPKATPTLTELTDTTLKQQVKNWYYSQSFNGTTILESNGDLPMIIKVRALKGE